MISRLALVLALRIVRAVARLVPHAAREDWRREWAAELQHRSAQLQRKSDPGWGTNMTLISRALGSLPDAAWIRRQFTLDADAVHDTAYAVRLLLRTPGFTVTTLLVFAIGIGAAIAIVSVTDAMFTRPLPVPHPERVMTVWQRNRETGAERLDVAPGNAIDWLARTRSFEAVAAAEPFTFNLNFAGREPDYLTAAMVSEQFFTVLGTSPTHGRLFVPQEYRPGSARVVILSHQLWTSRFGGHPSIVGTTVRLDAGDVYTIVGVLPRGLELRLFDDRGRRPETQLWIPKPGFDPAETKLRFYGAWNVLGRLRPDVTPAQAQAEFDVISAQLARDYPQTNGNIVAQVVPLRVHLVGSLRRVLPLLLGAALILLMVACANVANLLLARGNAREREFAIREAIGASRVRLVRQMLVESLLLAVAGGTVGLAFSRWTLDVIARLRPRDIALLDYIPIDARSAAIAIGLTLAAAVAAGLAPAWQLSRPTSANALREGRTGPRRRLGRVLVVVEVAAALVLLVGAGLLVRSFVLIQGVDPGFSRDNVSVLQIFASPRIETPAKRIVFFRDALERMRALPGVVAAGGVTAMPFGEARVIARGTITVTGRAPGSGDQTIAYTTAVMGDYFQAMGVPLLAGRLFDATDTAASRQVVLVSRRATQQFWQGADPVGSRVRFQFSGKSFDAEVVGVTGDLRHEALDVPAAAEIFLPYSQSGFRALTLVVRTAPGSPANLTALKEQIWALDPLQTIFNTARLNQLVSKTLAGPRFNLFVIGGFALATLVLALAGVYGVMSFSTGQRVREFGVRVALGATGGDIVRLVLRDGVKLAVLGVSVGTAVAFPVVRLLRGLVFGVRVTDPLTFVTVGIALVIVAAAACSVPAFRALKVRPVEALKSD